MDFSKFLHNLPQKPGVYSMQNSASQCIYVGKAKNLRRRISSYFYGKTSHTGDLKTTALIKEIANIEITVTSSELEALLLENKLINRIKPKYNIIFKDDKSYPYIVISHEDYPRVYYCRHKNIKQARYKLGELYGPYPDRKSVKISLEFLYRVFKIRSCNPVFFHNRTRPCMEYQINRCSAPCVGLIDPASYAKDLASIKLFLQAKSKALTSKLKADMRQAAEALDYELAAKLRDQLMALATLQQQQKIISKSTVNLDVIGLAVSPKMFCVHVLKIRQGDVLSSRQFFSKNNLLASNSNAEDLLADFILQNYLSPDSSQLDLLLPQKFEILTSVKLANSLLLSKAIGRKIFCATTGDKLAWQNIAHNSAHEALISRVSAYRCQQKCFDQLAKLLGRSQPLDRITCFDISHTTGKETIGAAVVFNLFGKEATSFRRFNLTTDQPGDDYQALQQTINRYLAQILTKPELAPGLLIIDGGKGQLGVAEKVLAQYQAALAQQKKHLSLLAIAKGAARKPGLEKFYLTSDGKQLSLPPNGQIFKLLQQIRDTAHNFAISSHRKKRDKLVKI